MRSRSRWRYTLIESDRYSLTVYDAIDMLVVLGNTTEFDRLVRCAADAEPSRAAVLLRLGRANRR